MYLISFIVGELLKLCIVGPVNMVLLPYYICKRLLFSLFRRLKSKTMKTEEEEREETRLRLVKRINKKGWFARSTPVQIKGREAFGAAMIDKFDYDPLFYQHYSVNPKELVCLVTYPGDSTVFFVNIDMLIKINNQK